MNCPEPDPPMTAAIVGSSGFVGAALGDALRSQGCLVRGFNSKSTPEEMRHHEYDLALIAAPHAKKWWANANSSADEKLVEKLVERLSFVKAEKVVLYSTIDVFPRVNGVDESADCSETEEPYGRNRFLLEQQVRTLFHNATVIRLPGLFGRGLQKNVLHDLLNRKLLDNISPRATYQWYGLDELWADTRRVLSIGEDLVALNSEPLTNRVLVREVFPELEHLLPRFGETELGNFVSYNVHSRFAFHWNDGTSPFMRDRNTVVKDLLRWKHGECHRG